MIAANAANPKSQVVSKFGVHPCGCFSLLVTCLLGRVSIHRVDVAALFRILFGGENDSEVDYMGVSKYRGILPPKWMV